MVDIVLIPAEEFGRVKELGIDKYERLALIADMCRANTLASVKRAGSGHLGSSFSAMEIVIWLYYEEMNTIERGIHDPERDIFFSSKGHDVPGLYSVFYSLGLLPEEKILALRRLGGLDGHPDIAIPGIEANSGSLGMGISKGRGMAWARRYLNRSGQVYVMTGDGELQEGQNYEAMQAGVHQGIGNLTVIVDHNKLQTDKEVSEILDVGDLAEKFRSFGWHVARCDGHDFRRLEEAFKELKSVTDRPKALVADTIKGRGVSFMEHPTALKEGRGLYRWHAGAPDDKSYTAAHAEIIERINSRLHALGAEPLKLKPVEPESKSEATSNLQGEQDSQLQQATPAGKVSDEYVAEAYGQALVRIAGRRKDIVVLDGDLSADCRIRTFEKTYPERFIENGIAEQDMVSMAGGLARQGLLPVVNTFASFLAARANEQIYNNAGERSKIIYACHYAGLIPAGPGKSHQSIRDISLFGALPNCVILEPCNARESEMALEYCVEEATDNCALRLIIGPSPRLIELPEGYKFQAGRGAVLSDGGDAAIFAYGPVMLHEALLSAEILEKQDFHLKVVNMPWLNRVDSEWLRGTLEGIDTVCVLEDHSPVGGLGDHLLNALVDGGMLRGRSFAKFGVEGYPACGTPPQALRYHQLDGASLAERIRARAEQKSAASVTVA
jgi:transketolase